MNRPERRQLELALRSARTTRTHAYAALLAHQDNDALAVRLARIHGEACAIESDVLRTLIEAPALTPRSKP